MRIIKRDTPKTKEIADIDNYKLRLNNCLELIPSISTHRDAKVIRELFKLHNEYYTLTENGTHCGTCRLRVYNKMKTLQGELNNG